MEIFKLSCFLYFKFPSKGKSKMQSEKCGEINLNADMVASKLLSKKGKRLLASASKIEKRSKIRKGIRNKNRQRSAILPTVFIPFTHAKPSKIKKKAKVNEVGAVSKKAT